MYNGDNNFHGFLRRLRSGSNNDPVVSYVTWHFYGMHPDFRKFRIVCRAFQGIGGSGLYSISSVMLYELVPSFKYPLYTASAIALAALGNTMGPIFGGLITKNSTWRWVFLLK